MPKPVHLTSRLLQCSTLQHPKGHPGQATAYTEHVCMLSAKKIKKGQYFRMSKTITLATYQAEGTLQDIGTYL